MTPAIAAITPPQPMPHSGAAGAAGAGGAAAVAAPPSPPPAPPAIGAPIVPPTRVSSSVPTGNPSAPVVGPRGTPALLPCPHCASLVNATLPFCSHCGKRTGLLASTGPACPTCGASVKPGVELFCGRCGTPVAADAAGVTMPNGAGGGTAVLGAVPRDALPRLALLNEAGETAHTYVIDRGELIIGRADGDIRFPDDVYLSPIHALFAMREGGLWLRDLGSRNGSWVFVDKPFRLTDGDVILVGSQLLRFRRLGYPGPHPPEADATRRLGSLVPNADVAMLQQLRGDGSVRDTLHLSPGRHVALGREQGDWVFGYDQTMSGRHAEIRSEDSEFVVHDLGSRNGVALATRGERKLDRGTRVLVGDQILRVESI